MRRAARVIRVRPQVTQPYAHHLTQPQRLLGGDVGHALTWVLTSIVLWVLERTPRPLAIAPNSSAIGLASSAITSVPAGSSPGLPSSPSPGAEPLNPTAPSRPCRRQNALIATPDSTIAIVSASSSRFRLRKPPCFMRSRAACSTGVRVRSRSSPMCL